MIISDDGSTDNTADIVSPYLKDLKIKYVLQPNKGVCAARNFGAKHATGKYLVFLDSDDLVLPNWLLDFKKISEKGFKMCYCSMLVEKPNSVSKKVSCLDPYSNGGKEKGISIPGTWAIEKKIFFELNGFDEAIKYGENTELKFRLLDKQIEFGFLDNYNLIYKESIAGGSKQTTNKLQSNLYILSKHETYFNRNPEVKRLFLQVSAVSAARLGNSQKAHELFIQAWKTKKTDLKLILQCLISIFPFFSKFKWKPIPTNIQ
jgi:glycosyltransferase involved in cell wall biosynthesis